VGEGGPLPRGRELTEGPVGRRGSLTRAQTNRKRDWSQGVGGCQRGDCGKRRDCGRTEGKSPDFALGVSWTWLGGGICAER